MDQIRVIIIDDSIVSRRILSRALSTADDMAVVGTASNGRLGLGKVARTPCDLVILDVEMPELGGLDTLKELKRAHPQLPVIMFSGLTRRGAEVTLDALSLGANDYLAKPRAASADAAIDEVARDIIPRIRALCPKATRDLAPLTPSVPREQMESVPTIAPPPRRIHRQPFADSTQIRIVAIGCSTGGPAALAELLPALGPRPGVPIVIVQHMPPIFTRLMAERLDNRAAIQVKEAEQGELLRADVAYVAPGDFHMELTSDGAQAHIVVQQGEPENSCRPAVDVLFRSVAEIYGRQAVGVILTGMGRDGLVGAKAMKARGATILAQDRATSVVWGMPGIVSREGLAEETLPLNAIGERVLRALKLQKVNAS